MSRSATIATCLLAILLGAESAAQSRSAAATPAPVGITWLVFVDDLHMDFRNTGRIRELLRSISTALMRDEDVVVIRASGPSSILIGPTSDRAIVDAASRRVAGNGLQPHEISEELKNPTGEIDVRLAVTFATASTLLDSIPGCPLRVLRPRLYSYASIGSRIATSLRFDLRNVSDTTIHSYFWRHASPVREANGGYGCQPERGLLPDTHHHESAHLGWRGPLTITIDFVQFLDGDVWLSSDKDSSVTAGGLHAGSQRAADYLLRVWRDGGMERLAEALQCIHYDVREPAAADRGARLGTGASGFYAGVARAAVVARSAADVESALLALHSTGA